MFKEIIGVVIGRINGNNKMGKTKDLFFTYIENAETMLPHIDKSNVGNNTPKVIKIINCAKLKFSIEGADKKILKINKINSTILSKMKQ